MIDWLKWYHHAPYPMRVLAASTRGYYLRWWRYGPEAERMVQEALERERWPAERWQAWQEERLAYVLQRAATKVPYYHDHWQRRRRQGDRSAWTYLENWPILDKEAVRQNPRAFVADNCDPGKMFHEHTSGTTGKSLDLWWSRETVRAWYALFEARCRRWYDVSRHDRWAILGGQLVAPVSQVRPPFWVWNRGLKQLYMSSYHLAPRLIPYYLDALQRYEIVYLLGYPSALHALAREAIRLGRRNVQMRVVVTNAEPLLAYQREAIAEAFNCPVRDTYGMAEIVAAAGECEFGAMHLWPETGIVEVMPETAGQDPLNEPGEFVCTGLLNVDMPLIRYRVGDRGALLRETDDPCRCGRAMTRVASIAGRSDDVLITADGRQIGRLDPVFKTNLPIREAQIIQESLTMLRVRYVPAENFTAEAGKSVIKRLQERMGPVDVVLEEVDVIPRTSNGKFRAVVSQLSSEEKRGSSGYYEEHA